MPPLSFNFNNIPTAKSKARPPPRKSLLGDDSSEDEETLQSNAPRSSRGKQSHPGKARPGLGQGLARPSLDPRNLNLHLSEEDDGGDSKSDAHASSSAPPGLSAPSGPLKGPPGLSKNASGTPGGVSRTPGTSATPSIPRDLRLKIQAEIDATPSIYAYDEVYDTMKSSQKAAEEAARAAAGGDVQGPRYIARLVDAAEQRKRDRLRAEEKKIQHERELEGGAFADKDAFVTAGYLAQQEALREEEGREAAKERAEDSGKQGMTPFLRSYLDQTSAVHEAAMRGADASSVEKAKAAESVGAGPSGPPKPDDPQSQSPPGSPGAPGLSLPPNSLSDEQIARDYERRTGKKVLLNDNGEIVDRRELLEGGLNIVGGRSAGKFAQPLSSRPKEAPRAVGRAPRGSRERMSREIERQMLEVEAQRKRAAEEREQERAAKVARRVDEGKIEELRRRALERRAMRAQAQGEDPKGD